MAFILPRGGGGPSQDEFPGRAGARTTTEAAVRGVCYGDQVAPCATERWCCVKLTSG
jgi:hypothetical protein